MIAGGVLAALVFGQLLFWRAAGRTNRVALASQPKPVTIVSANAASYRPLNRYVGTLEPWVEARIGPQIVSAYVSTVLVRPGAAVHRGDVLATLDCREATAVSSTVAHQARALEARQAAIAAQAARISNLLDGGFTAPNEVEQQQAESAAEEARLLATRAQLLGSSLAVSDCVLRAPFDGEVGDRTSDPGTFVRPGSSIVSVVDRSTVRVTADVPEGDFNAVAPDTSVSIRVLATGLETRGAVARRSPSADPSTRTIHMEIDLPNEQRSLPVHTTAELKIEVGQPARAIEVPLTAADVDGAKAHIVVAAHGVAHVKTLRVLGERGGSLFLEPQLPPGTHVVTEGRAAVDDGDKVTAKFERSPGPGAPRPASGEKAEP